MLLKVIKRICDKNPELQELIDPSVLICAEEGVSTEHVFFYFAFLWCCVYRNRLSRQKGRRHKFLCVRKKHMEIPGFSLKRSGTFTSDKEKKVIQNFTSRVSHSFSRFLAFICLEFSRVM